MVAVHFVAGGVICYTSYSSVLISTTGRVIMLLAVQLDAKESVC